MTSVRRALFDAHLAADRAGQPWLAASSRAVLFGVLIGLIRGDVDPFGFALFAVSLLSGLVALALVGDWAHLLRSGEEEDWLASLPASDTDRRVARALYVMALVVFLSLPSALIGAVLLPEFGLVTRAVFFFSLLGSAVFTAAVLSLAIQLFAGRLESLWITLQALGLGAFVLGIVEGLGRLEELTALPDLGAPEAAWLWWLPPAWFAAPTCHETLGSLRRLVPLVPILFAVGVLFRVPIRRSSDLLGRTLLDRILSPARTLATKFWVRDAQRGMFDLVYDALPKEREVVLRSYPLVALPLVFLVLAISGAEDDATRADFLAVVQFGAALYLPVLVSQVPVSRSWRAAWIQQTAPTHQGELQVGAYKAVVVRFVLPLYLLFALLTLTLDGPLGVLRLTLPALCVAALAVAHLWPACVASIPLSESPDEFTPSTAWYANLIGWTFGFTILGILVQRKITSPLAVGAFLLVILALVAVAERRLARVFRQSERANSASASSSG